VGNGTLTDAIAAMPKGPPTAPRSPRAVPADGSVTLDWRAPENQGGTTILNYRVYRGPSEGALAPTYTVDGLLTSLKDTDVINGLTYYYAVSAVSDIGEGPKSPVVNATPRGLPGTPRSLTAEPGDGQAALAWEAPDYDGGSPILAYQVYRGDSADQLQPLKRVGGLALTDIGLTNGQAYYYKVAAVNGIGEGSGTTVGPITPLALPDAPRDLIAEGGVRIVTVRWSAPVSLGGGMLTGYRVYRGESPSAMSVVKEPGAGTNVWTDTDVLVGRTYHYAVAAVTEAGEGPRCPTASAVPYGPPGVPRNLTAVAADGKVTLKWEAPSGDGGWSSRKCVSTNRAMISG
jgi:fibronectin type 3 domain-containing protein